ncbi:alpha/beta-Hydrolases superfamily protein [Trifolium repens]|nr:alpha/beta-Hydrolases superfamily protein [Trifolium repens]
MWGFGGRYYWGRRERKVDFEKQDGIVVVFAWMSSEEKHLMRYVDLYSSLGWNSLICHSQFLNIFFPDKATILAVDILNELVEVLKIRPCPIVFASFSGGAKACMLKVLQIISGKSETHNMDDYQLVKDCISGYIYDSSPVDFTSDMGVRFILHPSVSKVSHPPRFASWIANGIASGLDSLFLNRFESQRAEYWRTLYSTTSMQVPYLIFCSENDDLAPFEVISNFFHRLKDLGGDVKLVKWSSTRHVGHFRHHPDEYEAAITEILGKAVAIYRHKNRIIVEEEKLGIEGTRDEITNRFSELRKAATTSTSFQGFAVAPSENSPSSMEYYDGKDVGSVTDERKGSFIHLPSRPSINANGVLGQILFDVCVPKTVEDWDVRSNAKNAGLLSGTRRHAPFNPIKCIRRSRL